MKKTLLAALLLTATVGAQAANNHNQFTVGMDYWSAEGSGSVEDESGDYNTKNNLNGYFRYEHDLHRFIPNVELQVAEFNTESDSIDNDMLVYDLTLFYSIFKQNRLNLDLGATWRKYDGENNDSSNNDYDYDEDSFMVYAAAGYDFGGGFGLFGDINMSTWSGSDSYDYHLGASYQFAGSPISLRGGWRQVDMDFGKVNQQIDGWFLGAALSF